MIDKAKELKKDLEKINVKLESLRSTVNEIRLYYKYQNDELDSSSEDFIVSFEELRDYSISCIDCLTDIIEEDGDE
jgi:SMC interacting uncharacterized protein involved in chromosome segregation